jgi:hypothetical protein
MKPNALLIAFILLPLVAMAKYSPNLPIKYWQLGEAFLNNGENIQGKIYYEIDKELLLVLSRGQVKTFSPNQIDRFMIFDKESGKERMFYSIPLTIDGTSRRSYFFEIMTEGQIVFLRKQRTRSDGFGLFVFDESQLTNYSGFFDYYFLIDQELIRIKRFRRDALGLMTNQREKIETFIEKNGLQLTKVKDQVMLLKYYNTLQEVESILVNDYRL